MPLSFVRIIEGPVQIWIIGEKIRKLYVRIFVSIPPSYSYYSLFKNSVKNEANLIQTSFSRRFLAALNVHYDSQPIKFSNYL